MAQKIELQQDIYILARRKRTAIKKVAAFTILIAILFSCTKQADTFVPGGGVVMTFDDHHYLSWLKADSLLRQYNWKATFCISLIGSQTFADRLRMLELQKAGHEIAGHGFLHEHAVFFVSVKGLDQYISDEILPMLDIFRSDSMEIVSFSYPYGSRNTMIDNALLSYFDILRGTGNSIRSPEKSKCFFNGTPLVYGLGLDKHFNHYSLDYFADLLSYAHDEGKILILYAHKPVETVTGDYQVSFETLETICSFVFEHGMHFYTLSDLAEMTDD